MRRAFFYWAVLFSLVAFGVLSPGMATAEEELLLQDNSMSSQVFQENDEDQLAYHPDDDRYAGKDNGYSEVRYSGEQRRIRCESQSGRYEYCRTGTRGYVRLDRQHSRTRCVEYDTWGASGDGSGIWVRDGCRATFVVESRSPGFSGGGYGWWGKRSFVCKSDGFQHKSCSVNRRGREVRLVRQLSGTRCVRGNNWGTNRDGIWVDRGCAGEFVVE